MLEAKEEGVAGDNPSGERDGKGKKGR